MSSMKPASSCTSHPLSSSGKTCPASSPTNPTPSDAFWAHWPGKAANYNHRGPNGRTQVVCLDPAAASRGGYSTPNISVSPNGASACFLWQVVVMDSIPQRYF